MWELYIAIAVLGVSVIGTGGAGLIWAIRQEGRITTLQALFERTEQRMTRMEAVLDTLECNPHTAHDKG